MLCRTLLALSPRRELQLCICQKRYRYKQKWASTRHKKTPSEHALSHFDKYYQPVYQDLWPSIRLALLSQSKFCALVNNYADTDEVVTDLASDGAYNIMSLAREEASGLEEGKSAALSSEVKVQKPLNSGAGDVAASAQSVKQGADDCNANLYDFMPVTTIFSENEQQEQMEMQQNIYKPQEMDIPMIEDAAGFQIPYHLKAFTQDRGQISYFSPAQPDINTNKLKYYLMDAASLLPVVALDLHPESDVLDLCAAPGGKSLAILQTMLPDKMYCIDHSHSRMQRLKQILKHYLPSSYVQQEKVNVIHGDGIAFCHNSYDHLQFDRVLVDVPCFTDRHMLQQDDNNMFRSSRMGERLEIQDTQRALLYAGILSCKPGGTVVYSTCTLSPPQNDGTVQAVLEKVWQETTINIAVKDTSHLRARFQHSFNFHTGCRFGQLVLPNITANFGPMYFCKLKRLN